MKFVMLIHLLPGCSWVRGRLTWWNLGAFCAALLVVPVCGEAAQTSKPLTYVDILGQLTDLDRLTRLQTGYRAGLASSWDRNSRTRWGANGDAGQYLRVEPSGEAVMMDMEGPGVVYRVWSANPMGKLRIYLDGASSPSFEWNFADLFDGKIAPFVKPLVYRRDSAQSASDCYLPIPFAKHIKITADKAHGEYYQFNYVLYPTNRAVPSFRLPLTTEEQAVLASTVDVWSHPGRDPKPRLAGQQTVTKTVTIAPGKEAKLFSARKAGVVRAVRARVESNQRYAWRKLVLRGVWDGAKWPQILTPLGPFFGFDWETAEYGSVTTGCQEGQAYQFYPMPFAKSGELSLVNHLEVPATVHFEVEWAPSEWTPGESVYFYARWRHEPDSTNFEYPFLETAGRGHFVGVSMPIDHPLDGWWGEGDEKVWVDEDDFPPYIGTGSEDYFGDAWGIRYLSGPSFGASSMKGHRTCNYRWHFMDFIPFTKRMRMTIENYGPNGQGPRGQYDYSSTAFWYQAERTPPFEQLRGVTFTGGDSPDAPPSKQEYSRSPVFSELSVENLRTYGLGATFAQQAEVLVDVVSKGAGTKVITDALSPTEFDREKAVDFGVVKGGQAVADIKINVAADGVYYPRVYTSQEKGAADLSLVNQGKVLACVSKPVGHIAELAGLFLARGEHKMGVVATTPGRAVFDALQLVPARRFAEAIEAEELEIVRATGGASPPRPSDPLDGVSAGRVLSFQAAKVGQGFVLSLGKRPAQPYVLGIRPMMGPKAGVIQAFVGDKPIGPSFDLYADKPGLGTSICPLGPVPAGVGEVEIRVVGGRDLSTGLQVGVDYLRWEPQILGPDTAEGIWAQVVGTHACEYRAQDLGTAYSGGHQFWVQPCDLNGWVDIALEIPKAGSYTVTAKYTKSWDYAIIQASMDGTALGPVVDTYAPSVVPGDAIPLGKLDLTAGRHVLRFQATGHHPDSKGYLMGIDHVVIR